MEQGFGDFPTFFLIAFGIALVVILAVTALVITSIVRSRKVLQDSGLDVMTAQAQIAARIANGPLAGRTTRLEGRLAELADLHRRGVITADEHDAARKAALGAQG